jgi:hypothetical protein
MDRKANPALEFRCCRSFISLVGEWNSSLVAHQNIHSNFKIAMTNTALSSSSSSSKAGVLRSGIAARKDTLLLKLGGKDVLHKAVDTFYDQLVKDPELEFFFRDIPDVSILKWHQFNFMSVAFAPVPENFGTTKIFTRMQKFLRVHAHLFCSFRRRRRTYTK